MEAEGAAPAAPVDAPEAATKEIAAPAASPDPTPSREAAPAPAAEGESPKEKSEKTKNDKAAKEGKGEGKSKQGKKGKDKDAGGKAEGKGKGKVVGKSKSEKGKGTGKAFETFSGPQGSGSGYRLNVKNLDENVTSDKLKKMFTSFGEVYAAQVKEQESGQSRCFGFVILATEEEGKNAIEGMNGKEIDGKFLSVGPAERRASVDGEEAMDAKGKCKGKGKKAKDDLLITQQQAAAAAYMHMQQYQQYFYLQQLNYYYQMQGAGAAPAGAAPSGAAGMVEFEGSLKSVSAKNLYGFIVCAATEQLYERDIYVDKELLPAGVKVMDRLKFTVELNEKGHPRAATCSFALP